MNQNQIIISNGYMPNAYQMTYYDFEIPFQNFMAWVYCHKTHWYYYVAVSQCNITPPDIHDLIYQLPVDKYIPNGYMWKYIFPAPKWQHYEHVAGTKGKKIQDFNLAQRVRLPDGVYFWIFNASGHFRLFDIAYQPTSGVLVAPGLLNAPKYPLRLESEIDTRTRINLLEKFLKPYRDADYKTDIDSGTEKSCLQPEQKIVYLPSDASCLSLTIKNMKLRSDIWNTVMYCETPLADCKIRQGFVINHDQIITLTRLEPTQQIITCLLAELALGVSLSLTSCNMQKPSYVEKAKMVLDADSQVSIKTADIQITSETPFYLWRFSLNKPLEYYGAYTHYQIKCAKIGIGVKNWKSRSLNC